jgi:hypothetical protein
VQIATHYAILQHLSIAVNGLIRSFYIMKEKNLNGGEITLDIAMSLDGFVSGLI